MASILRTTCMRLPISVTQQRGGLSGWAVSRVGTIRWLANPAGESTNPTPLPTPPNPTNPASATPNPTNPTYTTANPTSPNSTTANHGAAANPTTGTPPEEPRPQQGPSAADAKPPQDDPHAHGIHHSNLKMGRLARLFDRMLSRPIKDADMRRLAAQTLSMGSYGVLLASALGTAGVDTKPILTAVGASSVVVGFALKDAATQYLAGLSLVLQKPFEAGDTITVLTFTGKVLAIDYRYVHLAQDAGGDSSKFVALPSALVYASPIVVVPGNRRRAPAKP